MIDGGEGLDGVIAAHTVLSDVDGEAGRLIIRGHNLDELAGRWDFEAVLALLWAGFFPDLPDAPADALGRARVEVFEAMSATPAEPAPAAGLVESVRALIARLDDGDSAHLALRLVAAPAVFTAALTRLASGRRPVAPDPALGHAADILRMTRGVAARPAEVAALDAYLVTVADHGLNASTFAARVVASTRAGLTSAVLAGLSALKGPLHGGAPGPVIDMLDQIGDPRHARAWLEAAMDRGDRLMGFGHRVYRVRDPRADALKRAVAGLVTEGAPPSTRLALAEAVESAALAVLRDRKPDRSLQTNVELYTALLLEALGFAPEAFTAVFAMGRTAGWIAHAREQIAGGRLVRPQSVYVGPRASVAA